MDLVTSADTNKNLSVLLAEITYSTYEDITCYNCTAKDSWCFHINDLINHGSEAQVKCASNQCFIAEYMCDDKNSDDCQVEYNNAVNNGTLDYFYRRCAKGEIMSEDTGHSSPRRLAGEKKSNSYNHKTTIWVSHEYYLNPEFHKILSGAF